MKLGGRLFRYLDGKGLIEIKVNPSTGMEDTELEKYVQNRSTRGWGSEPDRTEVEEQMTNQIAAQMMCEMGDDTPTDEKSYKDVLIRRSDVMNVLEQVLNDFRFHWTRGSLESTFEYHLDQLVDGIEGEKSLNRLLKRAVKGRKNHDASRIRRT